MPARFVSGSLVLHVAFRARLHGRGQVSAGVDTVKLVWPIGKWEPGAYEDGWGKRKGGTLGPVWWSRREHESGLDVTFKGCGADTYAIWEGSVPKALCLAGPASGDDVRVVQDAVRGLLNNVDGTPALRRVDLTHDAHDPERLLLDAALGWNPHARSRYVEATYDDGKSGRTVWLHNKTRGVRVYDKERECGEPWAADVVRVEYQVRGRWLGKYGLDVLDDGFTARADAVLSPLVQELTRRVGA